MIFDKEKSYLDLVIKLTREHNLQGVEDLTIKQSDIIAAELMKTTEGFEIIERGGAFVLFRRTKELATYSDYLCIILILREYDKVFR